MAPRKPTASKPKPAAKPKARKPATKVAAAKSKPRRKGPAKKRAKPQPAKTDGDLLRLGGKSAHIVSVFGPFKARVLLEMSIETAEELFEEKLERTVRTNVIEAAERDVAAIRVRDAALADSALAAAAVALAYEILHPHNSATSKSMCVREMRDTLDRLRELAPEEEKEDGLDELGKRRRDRLKARAS